MDSRFEQVEPKDPHNVYKKVENSVGSWKRSPMLYKQNRVFNRVWCPELLNYV